MKLKLHLSERRLHVNEMCEGEVYKHPGLPGLYMKIETPSGKCVVNLGSGRALLECDMNPTGWIHCPNATCVEDPDK